MQDLSSFFVQSVNILDQGPFPGRRIEVTWIGRDGRGETGNFVLVKLGQQQIIILLAQSKNDIGAVTQDMCLTSDACRLSQEIMLFKYCIFCAS